MRRGRWRECLVDRGAVFIARGADEIRATFGDYAALAQPFATPAMPAFRAIGGR